jgi:hypothetical protein
MIQTIRLHLLLREAVATPYRNLVTRPTGAAVRSRIEAALARTGGGVALLDFSEVDLLDLSCADEIVAKLLLAAEGRPHHLVLVGLHDHQRETIEHVLTHHGLAILAIGVEHGPLVLGRVPDDARAVLAHLADVGSADPTDVADALGWDRARAAWALETLAAQRLVRRETDGFHPLRVA